MLDVQLPLQTAGDVQNEMQVFLGFKTYYSLLFISLLLL